MTRIVPIGAGYTDTFAGFVEAALDYSQHPRFYLLVLPIAFASDAFTLSAAEFLANYRAAEHRRRQLEAQARAMLPPERTCEVALLPIFQRETALALEALAYLPADLAGVYFLGGDQIIAMQIIAATPLESALYAAFQRGVPMGGNSAGLAIFSQTMIAGYGSEQHDSHNALEQGAVEIWNRPQQRGLSFGCTTALLEQHFWELARLPRVLNALAQPNVPLVAVGADAFTGAYLDDDRTVRGAFGLYNITILDAQTYHAAANARYVGARQTLSMHNVLVHLLAAGDFAYDLVTRQTSLAPTPPALTRNWALPPLPHGAGTLWLGGELAPESALWNEFSALCGGDDAVIWVGAVGYAEATAAQSALAQCAAHLTGKIITVIVDQPITDLPPNVSGIIVLGADAAQINPITVAPVRARWRAGVPLLLDGAAAALAGTQFAAHAPTPPDPTLREQATQGSFLAGNVHFADGLALLPLLIEPRIMHANRWGYWFALAYTHPDQLAIGIAADTVLALTPQGAVVQGHNGVFVLDLQHATRTVGANQAYVLANGLLDVFGAGETVQPVM
jgi:cyanophycinase